MYSYYSLNAIIIQPPQSRYTRLFMVTLCNSKSP